MNAFQHQVDMLFQEVFPLSRSRRSLDRRAGFDGLRTHVIEWLHGTIPLMPLAYGGPPDNETAPLIDDLVAINHGGLLTVNSQPTTDTPPQHAQLDCFGPTDTVMHVAKACRNTGLWVRVAPALGRDARTLHPIPGHYDPMAGLSMKSINTMAKHSRRQAGIRGFLIERPGERYLRKLRAFYHWEDQSGWLYRTPWPAESEFRSLGQGSWHRRCFSDKLSLHIADRGHDDGLLWRTVRAALAP